LNEKGCIPRLYRHAKRGRITNPKLGGRTFVLSDDLAAYLRELPISEFAPKGIPPDPSRRNAAR